MSLLPRWPLRRNRVHEAALEQQVTALQAALAQCRGAAGQWARLRTPVKVAIVALILAVGFALGAYSGPVKQSIADLGSSLGLAAPNADAANAAYQQRNYAEAQRLARPLAEQGSPRARTLLGLIHLNGRGVPKDEAQAAKWFRLAAEEGDAKAQFHLGNMYSEGLGVPQDHGEAVNWYLLAAEQGDAQAQYNLGLWYATGEGGALDNVRAHMWFNLAATRFPVSDARGQSIKNRDIVAGKMTREEIAEAQKRAREWQQKSDGVSRAQRSAPP